MAQPKILYPAGEAQIPSPKDAPESGELIVDSALGVCVVMGLNLASVVTGDLITVHHARGPVARVPSASGTTFAKNAVVEVDSDGKTAIADGGGGTDIGRAINAKASGVLFVDVLLDA